MLHAIHNAQSRRRGLDSVVATISAFLVLACDRDAANPLAPSLAAAYPSVLGSYTGSGVVKARHTSGLSYTFTCAGTITIPTQAAGTFSGTFAVQAGGKCDHESGTVAGTVGPDGSVTFTADLPGGGPDVWADAAARTRCQLVSSTPFTGSLSGNTLSAAGSAVYDCPTFWGRARMYADGQVSVTRA